MPPGQVARSRQLVPQNPAIRLTLKRRVADEGAAAEAAKADEKVLGCCHSRAAGGTVSTPLHHAAGSSSADRPADELAPLYRESEVGDCRRPSHMKWVEQAGLVKFAFWPEDVTRPQAGG